jgi:hypothetical protein
VLFIRATALDSSYVKDYKIDLRVHKYDVEAFQWEKIARLSVQGTVVSQKVVSFNGKYYFFYRNEAGNSYVIVSEDGKSWEQKAEISLNSPDWATLTSMYSASFAVKAIDGLYVWNAETNGFSFLLSDAVLPENATLKVPLFTLGNKFWVIAQGDNSTKILCYLPEGATEYVEKATLSPNVPVEKVTAFVSPSGITMLGYILGGSDARGNGTAWVVDASGNIGEMATGTLFPALSYPMPIFFKSVLYIAGGKATDNSYSYEFYGSSNSGISWSKDTHKILPDSLPVAAGSIFEYGRNKAILIGGENEQGFLPEVWEGTLKQEILDELMYR